MEHQFIRVYIVRVFVYMMWWDMREWNLFAKVLNGIYRTTLTRTHTDNERHTKSKRSYGEKEYKKNLQYGARNMFLFSPALYYSPNRRDFVICFTRDITTMIKQDQLFKIVLCVHWCGNHQRTNTTLKFEFKRKQKQIFHS